MCLICHKGYALLDEVCTQPCCNGEVPLIQDRQGNKICVQCTNRDTQDETCKDEENYVSLKVKKQTDVTDNFSEDSDELVEEKMQKLVNRNFQTNVPDSTKSSSTSIPNDSDKALKVLTSKFNAAVKALEAMDPVRHSSSVAQNAEMIQKLANAIEAVRNIV